MNFLFEDSNFLQVNSLLKNKSDVNLQNRPIKITPSRNNAQEMSHSKVDNQSINSLNDLVEDCITTPILESADKFYKIEASQARSVNFDKKISEFKRPEASMLQSYIQDMMNSHNKMDYSFNANQENLLESTEKLSNVLDNEFDDDFTTKTLTNRRESNMLLKKAFSNLENTFSSKKSTQKHLNFSS